jgi:hypothetical protein
LVLQALSSPLKKNSFVQTNKFFPPKWCHVS